MNGYDEYGNPNVHGRTEERIGNQVKGQYRVSSNFFFKIQIYVVKQDIRIFVTDIRLKVWTGFCRHSWVALE